MTSGARSASGSRSPTIRYHVLCPPRSRYPSMAANLPQRRAGARDDRVGIERRAPPRGDGRVEVELEPPCAGPGVRRHRRPPVAADGERGADRARVEQPLAAGQVERLVDRDRHALGPRVGPRPPRGRLVRVADEADRRTLAVQALARVRRRDVLVDRVARAPVPALDAGAPGRRPPRAQPGEIGGPEPGRSGAVAVVVPISATRQNERTSATERAPSGPVPSMSPSDQSSSTSASAAARSTSPRAPAFAWTSARTPTRTAR